MCKNTDSIPMKSSPFNMLVLVFTCLFRVTKIWPKSKCFWEAFRFRGSKSNQNLVISFSTVGNFDIQLDFLMKIEEVNLTADRRFRMQKIIKMRPNFWCLRDNTCDAMKFFRSQIFCVKLVWDWQRRGRLGWEPVLRPGLTATLL